MTCNPRMGRYKTLAEFVKFKEDLELDYPNFIDHAVPENRECGKCPKGVYEDLKQYCGQIAHSVPGQ